ncbi:MAG: NERD domain-containing protein [Candidatus Bathyarchaeota archaeon]|nr:NERD domain-containing protein [Candidatus Bathyarchaeota archaeon]
MRKIKASNSYLKNQVRKNFAKAALSLLILLAVFALLIYRIVTSLHVGLLEIAGFVFLLAPLVTSYYYLRRYHIYSGGLQGERNVADHLTRSLNDDYYLINDLYLQGGGGDIDHVVLGPTGVFVLETKNWSGNITCNRDSWQRSGKQIPSSPSQQVRRNAAKIRHIIDSSPDLHGLGVWVEGVVVFTNKHAMLHLYNPAVPIVMLPQLSRHISTHLSPRQLSRQELEALAKEVVKQKR